MQHTAPARPFRRLGQVPALDGLRGVAVLLVVVSHTALLTIPGAFGISFTNINRIVRGGFFGVDIFFVLSGFLITSLLLREQVNDGRIRFGNFYARRALRLLPALVVLLFAHAVYAAVTGLPADAEVNTVWSALLYVLNWRAAFSSAPLALGMGHLWSLAVEEQFYLVWPAVLVLFFGLRRRASFVSALLITAIVVVVVHRALVWGDGVWWIPPFIRTDTRADSLLVGVLLASLWVRGRTPTRGLVPAAWIASVGLVVCIAFTNQEASFVYRGGFTLFALLVAVVVLAAVDGRWPGCRVLELGPLRLVGRVSYGLYLWHLPIFVAVDRYTTGWSASLRVLFAYGLTVLFTALSWRFVEQPALRLKKRLEVAREPASVVPEPEPAG